MPDVPKFETTRAEGFETVFVTGAFGTLNAGFGQIMLYYDLPTVVAGKITPEKGPEMSIPTVKRVFLIDARMSPETFRGLAIWMADHVKRYDEQMAKGGKGTGEPGPSYG